MSNIGYLLAANVIVWAGVCGYLGILSLQQKRLKQRLTQLELIRDEHND
jgi:CcmD family protein